ncbi:type VI immunity family protein [Myxococcus virescens]|uniref:DUF3396 domain-containing protein n=1 Tax=Myxococcus virescens TaxID=83456 RepID=A0A511H999_9BACT|nr:type VI immunity family protein [Myxococcus virescens]GEL70107.1 hypothetical protein MVI01_18910 [Myxococcus virescens]SDD80203.1 Protein of unknown function [Myxococcus virescens]
MTEHYPRLRVHARNGHLVLREGLNICFYMHRPHAAVAQHVLRALETFREAVGADVFGRYADSEGDWHPLDASGWQHVRSDLQADDWAVVRLQSGPHEESIHAFEYHGKDLQTAATEAPGAVTALGFWLPTERLEDWGPQRIRELALDLARPLPFCSGHAGLSFNGELDLVGVEQQTDAWRFRYPGLDIIDVGGLSWKLGTRLRGPSWLTFLGQPVLDELNGAMGLQTRLSAAGTTVQALDDGRAVVTLGERPEAGDMDQGDRLPAYRELARALEPWMYREEHLLGFGAEAQRRWERRFLD